MLKNKDRRKYRVRNKITENNKSKRPRIVVCRTNKNIYAQLVDISGNVLFSYSTLNVENLPKITGVEKAKLIGKEFASSCLKKGIEKVVFDKGEYKYNGRIMALAQACREAGLKF